MRLISQNSTRWPTPIRARCLGGGARRPARRRRRAGHRTGDPRRGPVRDSRSAAGRDPVAVAGLARGRRLVLLDTHFGNSDPTRAPAQLTACSGSTGGSTPDRGRVPRGALRLGRDRRGDTIVARTTVDGGLLPTGCSRHRSRPLRSRSPSPSGATCRFHPPRAARARSRSTARGLRSPTEPYHPPRWMPSFGMTCRNWLPVSRRLPRSPQPPTRLTSPPREPRSPTRAAPVGRT